MVFFFFQAEDGIRDSSVTGVQTCALPISNRSPLRLRRKPTPGPARRYPDAANHLERFQAKWRPVRVKKTRQTKDRANAAARPVRMASHCRAVAPGTGLPARAHLARRRRGQLSAGRVRPARTARPAPVLASTAE